MNERKKLLDLFFNALTRLVAWTRKHQVEKEDIICYEINEGIETEFELCSYYDGSMSLDRRGYTTHVAFANSMQEIDVLLNAFLAAHGYTELTVEDL